MSRSSFSMNLLALTSSYPVPHEETASCFLRDWAHAHARNGWRVEMVAPARRGEAARTLEINDIQLRCFSYFTPHGLQRLAYGAGMMENVRHNPLLLLQLPALIASFYRAARRRARSADIVHAHWLFPAGMVGAVLRRAGAGPLVISVHSTDFHLLRSLPGGRTLARSLVRQCDRIHFVADYLRADFGNWIGEPKFLDKKSYVVPMGVSDGLFATPLRSHSPTVGFIGRLISSKGVDELIRVCARVKPSNLVIAGTGPEEHALRTLSTRLEVPHTFMGPVSGSAKDAFFAQSDIVVFPSRIYASGRTEGMPVALLEAMRCGRVVLAADVGGIPEVVRHGVNGYLFRAGDRQSFTSLLGSILANWSQYRQVSVAATETGTRFTASRISQDHEAVYQRLLRSV